VLIRDILPLSLTLAMSDTSKGSYDALTGIWDVGKVLASQSATLTLMTTVLTGTAGQTITNTAAIVAVDQDDSNGENNIGTAVITVTNADLALSKTVDLATPTEGDAIAYTVTISNNGPDATDGVMVGDPLPLGLTLVASATSQGNYTEAAGAWEVGSLSAGASATMTLTATVNPGTAGQTITNTAVISASANSDANLTNNRADATIKITSADLIINKTVSDTLLDENDLLTYTITVGNSGPDEATGVVVSDPLPLSLSLVTSATSQGSYDSNLGAWQVGNLGITDTAILTLTALIQPDTAGQTITNTAEVGAADQFDPSLATNTSSAVITVTNAELAVIKAVDVISPTEGDPIVYTVAVVNNGSDDAAGVVISDTLPLSLTLVTSDTSQGSYDSGNGLWTVGSLPVSDIATLTLEARVNAGTVGQSITNTAQVGASDRGDSNQANNADDAVIAVVGADLVINKSATRDLIAEDNPLTYTITVANNGPLTATDVVLTDTLAAQLNFVAVTPNGPCAEQGGTITCTLASLNSGAVATVTIAVTTSLTGTIPNTASVTGLEADPNPANNTASVETNLDLGRTYLPVLVKEQPSE
jgi:uncharacterized repeat protein (TIGR01451 family)